MDRRRWMYALPFTRFKKERVLIARRQQGMMGNLKTLTLTDIRRLEAALGHPLEKGACINFKLQDILHIIPKKRRRVDSYRGLVGKLNKMGVKLTINSQKSR